MDKREPKNLLPEEEYLKQMSALPKVKAPEDFLHKVHERIERRSAFEKIMRALFVPVKVKVPLELAAIAAAIVLIISTVGIKKPAEQLAYAPKAKMEIMREVRPEDEKIFVNKGSAIAENRPVEIALLIGAEEAVAGVSEKQRSALVDRVETETASAPKPYLAESLSKVNNLIELSEGKVTAVVNDKDTGMPQYIDAEIPAADYAKFVEELSGIGVLQEPILKEAPRGQGIIQVRIRLLTK